MFEGYRLSPQQRQLWLLEQTTTQYAQIMVAIAGSLNKDLLLHALQTLQTRHEILRTEFQFTPGIKLPVQVIIERNHIDLVEYDLQDLPAYMQEELMQAHLATSVSSVANGKTSPILQTQLFILSDDKYMLSLTFPALYADTVALTNLLRDLLTGYTAALEHTQLSEVSMQYADISQWFNDLLDAEESEESARRTDYLEKVAQLISLRLPYALKTEQYSSGGDTVSTLLPQSLLTDLQLLAKKYEISLANVLLSCWQLLLWQLTHREEFAIGVTFDGRNYAELEDAVGPLTICVPLHMHLTGECSWRDMAQRLHTVVDDIYSHQEDFLWEKVARIYQLASPVPRFAFGFEFIQQPESYTVGDTSFSVVQQRTHTGYCDLKLICTVQQDGLTVMLDYDPAIYHQSTISRLLDQFEAVLKATLLNPEILLENTSILGKAEMHLLLHTINETEMVFSPTCLHHLFEQQVTQTPQRIAVIDGYQKLTYKELDERANSLAHHLQRLGVGPEVLVALYMEQSVEVLVAMLATLKAGGAYVPLDPALSPGQVAVLIADAHIEIVFTNASSAQIVGGECVTVVNLTQISPSLQNSQPVESIVNPLNVAYVLFTSGSTGKPKGVAIEHRQICNYVEGIIQRLEILSGCTFAMVSSFSADLGNTVLFSSLCTGGILHIISPERMIDPEALAAYFGQYPPDYLKIVPSHLAALLSGTQPTAIVPLKKIILGGETLHWNLVERLHKLRPTCSIINHYGPTETTVGVLTEMVKSADSLATTCPIGYPLANTHVYLLNTELQVVPTMMAGEIYIGGNGVGRGYLQNPALTAERFIPDPFSSVPGARLYYTGDMGRYLPDGRIEFLGRTDAQIKIRGFRVELDGIELQIRQHSAVRDAVVLLSGEEHKQLTAYIIPTETATPTYKGKDRYTLPNNLSITQLNTYETDFFYEQIFVQHTELKHGIDLPENAVVLDIGANIGLFTLFVQQHCKNAKIYAFEPIPPIFEILRLNTELYAPTTELFQLGLSDYSREETFTYYPQSSCQSGYYADVDEDMHTLKTILLNQEHVQLHGYVDHVIAERSASSQFTCQLKTLSAIISECSLERIDLLKIDVEKSELDILIGIIPQDWSKIDQIVIEAHNIDGRIAVLMKLLEQKGYTVYTEQSSFIQDTVLYNLYARRQGIVRQASQNIDFDLQLPTSYLTPAGLNDFLIAALPHYMLPSNYVFLDCFPLKANGKVDRTALQNISVLETSREQALTLPTTDVEKMLMHVWQEVLSKIEIGIHDNFFSLGGDSILAILVVGQASNANLHFTTKQIFQYPTIAGLALVVNSTPLIQSEQGPVSGPVQLTPLQRWFFETVSIDRHHWNQTVLLKTTQFLQPQLLESALQHVFTQHDMLRARFFFDGSTWQQSITAAITETPFQVIDLTGYPQAMQQARLREITTELQAVLNLENGKLVQAALFKLSTEQRLFIIMHHLIVDGVSWRILLEDLQNAYEQAQQNLVVQLPKKTTSFKQWAESLTLYAQSADLEEELVYWLEHIPDQVRPLKVDYAAGLNTVSSQESISFSLTFEETTALLQIISEVFNIQINDVLLAALAQTFATWLETGYLLIDLEGHGREPVQENLDLSRTIGWFTTLFPITVDLHQVTTSEKALKSMKEDLRSIPHRGIGYGLLRYVNEKASLVLSKKPRAQVRFNYLGQIEQTNTSASIFSLVAEDVGPAHSLAGLRSHFFDINARILDGCFHCDWLYSTTIHAQATVEALATSYAQSLRALLDYCQTPDAGGYTPSDFPRSKLNQDELDDLLAQLSDVLE